MKMQESRKGELLIFSAGLMWSFFPIVVVLTYASLTGLASLAWATLFSAIFFAGVVTYRGKWSELGNTQLWKYAVAIAAITGVLFYVFYFIGLQSTSPGNAALIALFEVFTSFVFFHVLRRDYIPREHAAGAVLMVLGAGLVLFKDFSGVLVGDLFILAAVAVAPLGNFFQQKARVIASSESIMFLRSLMATPAIFLLAHIFHASWTLAAVQASIFLLLINGFLLLGLSKIMWIEAIHRISVTKSVALSSLNPFFTLVFAWLILSQRPDIWQLAALVPLIAGVMLLTDNLKLSRHPKTR